MISIIIGNIIALIASILMVYSGTSKQKKKILHFQTVQIGMLVISDMAFILEIPIRIPVKEPGPISHAR